MLWPLRRAPRLDWIQVEVTTECSANCRYCPRHVFRDRWIERRLSLETFEALLPELKHVDHIHLQGWGEPLKHPDLVAMVRLAKSAGHEVGTTTNAVHFTDEVAEQLVDAGLDVLAFSLAGVDVTNDCIRSGTRISKVRQAIERLREIGARKKARIPRLHVAYMLLRSRLDDIERLPPLLGELGVDEAVLSSPSLVVDPGFEAEASLADDPRELAALEERLGRARDEAARVGCDLHFHVAAPFREARACSENVGRSCVVTSAGEIVPCVFAALPVDDSVQHVFRGRRHPVPSLAFGSIATSSLQEIWHSRAYRAFRREALEGDVAASCVPCLKRFIQNVERAPGSPQIADQWASKAGRDA